MFLLVTGLGSFLAISTSSMTNLWIIWHRHLVHLNNDRLASLLGNSCLKPSIDNKMLASLLHSRCISCCLSKSHSLTSTISKNHQEIYTTLWSTKTSYEIRVGISGQREAWVESVRFMSCILVRPEWFIGLANNQVQGHGYFGHCTGAFLGAKKAEITNWCNQ